MPDLHFGTTDISRLDAGAYFLMAELKAVNYSARAGQTIVGNLGRDARGHWVRVGADGKPLSRSSSTLVREAAADARRQAAAAPKTPKGRAKGKGKGHAAAKPKQTPEEKQAAREQKKQQNRAQVFSKIGLDGDIQSSLLKLANGDQPDGDVGGIVDAGLAVRDSAGQYRLTPQGRALLAAANAGDAGRARDALSLGKDRALAAGERAGRAQTRKEKAEARAKEVAQRKAERAKEQERKKREKQAQASAHSTPSSEPKPTKPTREEAQQQNRTQLRDEMAADDVGIAPGGFDALMQFADGGELSDETIGAGLADTGLIEQDSAGGWRLTTEGRQFARAADQGDKRGALDALSRSLDKLASEQEIDDTAEDTTMSGETKAIGKRDDVSASDKDRAMSEYGDVDYADEKNKKYPIDTEAHIRAAWNYINQEKNQAKYNADEVATIKRKIVAAWKDKIDKAGPPSADAKSYFREGDDVHPGAMIALLLTDETREALLDAADLDGEDAICDHCTLVYLTPNAEDLDAQKNRLVARLADIASITAPVSGVVNGYGRFVGDDDEGDALYANVDCPALPGFRQQLAQCLEVCGISAPNEHGFTPHITLQYLDEDDATPDLDIPKLPLAFDYIALIWHDETLTFPLLGETPVEHLMQALGAPDMALAPIGEVKSLGDFRLQIKGVVYGGHDLVGDEFDQDTDLGAERSFIGMPVYYDHAMRGVKSQIGKVVAYHHADDGIDFEVELDRHKSYVQTVLQLQQAKALGGSTGALSHLVIREGGMLKRWIVGELSLTPTAAEPRTHADIYPNTKSVDTPEVTPEPARSAGARDSALKTLVTIYMTAIEHDIKAQLDRWAGVRNHA